MKLSGRRAVAAFDSSSGMVRALARCLRGKDLPALGLAPAAAEGALARASLLANRLPVRTQAQLYTWSGWRDAIPMARAGDVDGEALARWAAAQYPRRRHPVVFVGASNGAAVHLAAALDAPFLPQTFLVPVRRHGVHPDEPQDDATAVQDAARDLLDANPDLQLHHMHDANQDRLMIRHMTYFRLKRRTLGHAYRRFLRDRLAPGGAIVLVDCGLRWPGTRLGERHVFQHGAPGGLEPHEYERGSPRVARFLAREGSHRRRWRYPAAHGRFPEAEWGLAPPFAEDVLDFARRRGHPVRRLTFHHPQEASPALADLYAAWLHARGLHPTRLMASQFLLLDPYWTLRTGSVPFWTVFNAEGSRRALADYIDRAGPFDEACLPLFSNGIEAAGQAPADAWRATLAQARRKWALVGVDAAAYPRDFGVYARYDRELPRVVTTRVPRPAPLTLSDVDRFFEETSHRYASDWSVEPGPSHAAAPDPTSPTLL